MSAYIIAGYEPYVPGVIPLLSETQSEILVASYEAEGLEVESR